MKKRGFGQGRLNGVGGKMKPGETIEACAIRETYEEIGVKPFSFFHTATLNFLYPEPTNDLNPSQQVLVYFVNDWEGDIKESEEMAPRWFDTSEIPYDKMWPDDKYWLPEVLRGKFVDADFIFSPKNKLLDFHLSSH